MPEVMKPPDFLRPMPSARLPVDNVSPAVTGSQTAYLSTHRPIRDLKVKPLPYQQQAIIQEKIRQPRVLSVTVTTG